MEEEHSIINNSNEIVSSSNSHRLQIRRNILRQTTTLRSSPYNSTLSPIRRRRENSLIASQTINNLITNIENNNNNNNTIQTNINDEIIEENNRVTVEEENNHDDFEVLVDFSNTSPMINEYNHSNESYHSLSTVDFDPDDDDHHYYYTSTSIPVLDYSSSIEPLIIPIDTIQYPYDEEYSPSINNNNINDDDDDEDLSIEIILESSQNHSVSPRPRRRHSIISSNNTHGLRLSDILSIPQIIYSSHKQQINNNQYHLNTQCVICLEDFQLIDSIKILNCQHIFHTACINEWLRSHASCAYCRTPVVIELSRTTTGRRQRTRARRRRPSTNNSIESPTFEQQL